MPNSSGFIDFNQYADLNQDEESRLMEEAMARAEAADSTAQQQLMRTSGDASRTNAESLSKVGSYSDYLKAKKGAADAWAAVAKGGSDPRSSALRGALGAKNGIGDKAAASAAELAGREGRIGQRIAEDYTDPVASKALFEARAKAQTDAAAKRAEESANVANSTYANAYARWLDARNGGQPVEDTKRYAQIVSGGVDAGWSLPGLGPEQSANSGGDRRGWAIENDAWGSPVMASGRTKTKKGTWY